MVFYYRVNFKMVLYYNQHLTEKVIVIIRLNDFHFSYKGSSIYVVGIIKKLKNFKTYSNTNRLGRLKNLM